jgi:hypothetical protein
MNARAVRARSAMTRLLVSLSSCSTKAGSGCTGISIVLRRPCDFARAVPVRGPRGQTRPNSRDTSTTRGARLLPYELRENPSGRGPLGRPSRLLWRWNEQVGWHTEACTQSLHHRHAQFLLAPKDLADPAWRSEDRDHVRPREAVLIHEVPYQFRGARCSARPLALLMGRDQTRLCLQPSHVGGIVRVPQPINEGARASSASLSITIRVASITQSPHQSCRTLHGCRRTGLPELLSDGGSGCLQHQGLENACFRVSRASSPQGGQNLSPAATRTC